jgi:hypothetical protein
MSQQIRIAHSESNVAQSGGRSHATWSALICGAVALACFAGAAKADEGGVSFWLPGLFGSLAAAPQQPGWSLATIYYHTTVSAGADVARAREITIGRIPVNLSANLSANLDARADLAIVNPTYVFATPFLGGQAAVGLMGIYGRTSTSLAGTLTGALTTPFGTIPFLRSDSISDSVTGFGDLYPQFFLRWNAGVHNYMTYITGDIPVGAYDSTRLSNIGLGHGAIDGGGGYTYFNPQTGHEFSAVLGFTYNFENQSTQYQNGVDMHLDWGASQFLTKQFLVGLVGLPLQRDRLRQRHRRPRGMLPVPGGRSRPAGGIHFSRRRDARLPQFQRLQGIRGGEPS